MTPGMGGRPNNGYHPVIDLDATPGGRDHGNRVPDNNGHLHYTLEKVRQTILDHESIFRSQLQELHHLYRRQKELTNEIGRVSNKSQLGFSFPPVPRFPTLLEGKVVPNFSPRIMGNFCQTGPYRDTKLSLNVAQASQFNNTGGLPFDMHLKRREANSSFATKDFFLEGPSLFLSGFRNEKSGNNHRSEDYAEKMRFEKRPSVREFCSTTLPVVPQERKEMARRKRKLFGVEIEDCSSDVVTAGSTSWIDRTFAPNLDLGGNGMNGSGSKTEMCHRGDNGNWLQRCSAANSSNPGKCFTVSQSEPVLKKDKALPDCRNDQENPKGTLPWFLRNAPDGCDTSKGVVKSPYFMNLDSLQNCSQNFFRKIETGDDITSMQKKETSAVIVNERSTGTTKILGVPILLQTSEDPPKSNTKANGSKMFAENDGPGNAGLDNYISDLRHCVDLNLSVDEEVSPSVLSSLPTTIVKIATTEIDLEAPAAIESDRDTSCFQELDQIAAEALVAISSHNHSNHEAPEAASSSDTSLKWFAEIISSQLVPDGMDYFEYTTLKLQEDKEERYHQHEVFLVQHPMDDDCTKRSRRGVSRRGVGQRKDFQRDILPGLITLSRLEVTEDIQAFNEVMKAERGCSSRQAGFARNGRGRKRSAGPALPATMTTTTAAQQQQPNCQMEDRSLTGWGKRTRRLPRQRCHNAFISFPVKC